MKSMNGIKKNIHKNTDVIAVGVFMLLCFAYVMFGIADDSDLPAHARGAQMMLKENRLFENNFLMYLLANVLSFFSGALFPIQCAIVVLIAASNTAKYVLMKNEFCRMVNVKHAMVASAALLFVFVIPVFYFLKVFGVFLETNNMYFQYYVPNVWHNSTILCMMPFAIVTFLLSIRQFEQYDKKRNGLIVLFVVLCTLVKPSFFFCYALAFPIIMFVRYRFGKEFFCSLLPVLIGCVCVLYEFLTIYDGGDGNGVSIDVLSLFTLDFWKSRILYFAVSMALPTLFVVFYYKEIYGDREFWFVLIMLVVALGIVWCCHETGTRASHGNFSWQVISAMWFVYYYILKTVLKSHKSIQYGGASESCNKRRIRVNKCFLVLYGIHVVMGLLYLIKYFVTKDMA